MADGLQSVLEDLETAGDGDEGEIALGEILDAFEGRSLGVLLTLFGAVAALPVIGAIPGMSIVTGGLILVAVAQSLFGGASGIWAPERLRKRRMSREKLGKAVEKARPVARRIDRLLKARLRPLASRAAVSAASAPLALAFIPLAVVPFGVQAPALAVTLLGLSLMARDGACALVGYAFALATVYILWSVAL